MSKGGRPSGSEQREVPPKIFDALQLYVWGTNEDGKNISWADAAEATGCHIRTLRKYRQFPECQDFLTVERAKRAEEKREALNNAHGILLDAAPAIANRLTQIALSPKTKDYVAESACVDIFKIIHEGVEDAAMRQKLEAIKEQLSALERGGPTEIDV